MKTVSPSDESNAATATKPTSAWRLCSWVCVSVVILSVASCIVLSIFQSVAITDITVTAIDPLAEPKDHGVPFLKQVEALPDYELRMRLRHGGTVNLGAKPNSSAAGGLNWHLYQPVSVRGVSTIRLQEQDKLISDALAEVEYSDAPITQNGYRFAFVTERSYATGLETFFDLPIGKAIAAGFTIAIFLLILSFFAV